MNTLSIEKIAEELGAGTAWTFQADSLPPDFDNSEGFITSQLLRVFDFDSYAEALGFLNSVAEIAERRDHHPAATSIVSGPNFLVSVILFTHSANGITIKDTDLAKEIDSLKANS